MLFSVCVWARCGCQWGQCTHYKNEQTRQLHACLLVRCVRVCARTGGVWGSWDPFSQTCTDLSNQTGIKGHGGRGEGRRALKCVLMCAGVCVCWFARGIAWPYSFMSVCICVCILMLWTSEPARSLHSC